MFQLIEKDGVRKAVHSRGDLDYMLRRGWKPVVQQVAAILRPPEPVAVERQKRKYTRKAA